MDRQRGVRVDGPLTPFRDGVREVLEERGYSKDRTVQLLLLMAHLSRWLYERALSPEDLTGEVVEQFFREWRARHLWCRSARSLAPILSYLRSIGAVPAPHGVELNAQEELLEAYKHYLIHQRGLNPTTVDTYAGYASACLREWWPDGQVAVAELGPDDVIRLVRSAVDQRPRPSLRCMVTALRSLLRFFHAKGMTERSLAEAVPAMATWPRTTLPSSVSADTAARLLGSCDTDRTVGLRDAAILSLLVRLGLRAGEIARLGLDDIDWRIGTLSIAGKGGRVERLPLPADVGEAIASYLVARKPSPSCRAVFLKAVAPHGPLSPSAVSAVVYLACDRLGIPRFGPHRLRHMVGTETHRAGAPLFEVAQLLRHADVATSSLYTTADPQSLVALAKPWPEVRP